MSSQISKNNCSIIASFYYEFVLETNMYRVLYMICFDNFIQNFGQLIYKVDGIFANISILLILTITNSDVH